MKKKIKDPAFLFYPQAWLEGTAEMSPEEKGVYIDLLAFQHQRGELPNNIMQLSRLTRTSSVEFEDVWRTLQKKFIVQDDVIYNNRLQIEMERRALISKKNCIKGHFSALLKKHKLEQSLHNDIKKDFPNDVFLEFDNETLQEEITSWFLEYCEKWYAKSPTKCQLKINHS